MIEVTYCYHRQQDQRGRVESIDTQRQTATVWMNDGTKLVRRLTSFMYRGVTLHAALAFGIIGGEA